MKRLMLAAFLLGLVLPAFPQGQVIFANNSATAITNLHTGLPASTNTQVALYVGNVGAPWWSLTMVGSVTNCFLPGRFSGGTRTLIGWTGTVQLQVRAWLASTLYPSYEAAIAGVQGGDFGVALGGSVPINFATTQPPTLPVSLANAGLTAIVIWSTPEPSAYVLALLCLGGVWLLRPRK